METVFSTVLNSQFSALPDAIRLMHFNQGVTSVFGKCDVVAGTHWLAKLYGKVLRLPKAANNCECHVVMASDSTEERWCRQFSEDQFCSVMKTSGDLLVERVGPVTFIFRLVADKASLYYELRGVRVFKIPLPKFLWPTIEANERVVDGRLLFHVKASDPFAGHIVSYKGCFSAIEHDGQSVWRQGENDGDSSKV